LELNSNLSSISSSPFRAIQKALILAAKEAHKQQEIAKKELSIRAQKQPKRPLRSFHLDRPSGSRDSGLWRAKEQEGAPVVRQLASPSAVIWNCLAAEREGWAAEEEKSGEI